MFAYLCGTSTSSFFRCFCGDGEVIASASQDQTVRIWDVKTGECLRVLIAKRLYKGMKLTGVKGLTDATIMTLQALGAVV